jgi:hypothetical protein
MRGREEGQSLSYRGQREHEELLALMEKNQELLTRGRVLTFWD